MRPRKLGPVVKRVWGFVGWQGSRRVVMERIVGFLGKVWGLRAQI